MARFPLVSTAPEPERAILVGVEWRDNAWPLDRSLDELERLAHTAGAQCVARLSQRLVKPYEDRQQRKAPCHRKNSFSVFRCSYHTRNDRNLQR